MLLISKLLYIVMFLNLALYQNYIIIIPMNLLNKWPPIQPYRVDGHLFYTSLVILGHSNKLYIHLLNFNSVSILNLVQRQIRWHLLLYLKNILYLSIYFVSPTSVKQVTKHWMISCNKPKHYSLGTYTYPSMTNQNS